MFYFRQKNNQFACELIMSGLFPSGNKTRMGNCSPSTTRYYVTKHPLVFDSSTAYWLDEKSEYTFYSSPLNLYDLYNKGCMEISTRSTRDFNQYWWARIYPPGSRIIESSGGFRIHDIPYFTTRNGYGSMPTDPIYYHNSNLIQILF